MYLRGQKRYGITRVELLLVGAMLAVVTGLAVPGVHTLRAGADRTKTVNRLADLGKATHNHAATYNGKLPKNGKSVTIGGNARARSIFYQLTPYIDDAACFSSSPVTVIASYLSPEDFTRSADQVGGVGVTNFVGNGFIFTQDVPHQHTSFQPFGAGNVVLFATRYAVCGDVICGWNDVGPATLFGDGLLPQFGVPQPLCTVATAQGFTEKELHLCMGDGSVRTIGPEVSLQVWETLSSPKIAPAQEEPRE
jgi:hypothetical protein